MEQQRPMDWAEWLYLAWVVIFLPLYAIGIWYALKLTDKTVKRK